MVMSCAAFGCKERFERGGKYTFHRFPTCAKRRKVWALALRRENFNPGAGSVVCSKHFTEECFDRDRLGGVVVLKSNAVPTIFDFPEFYQTKINKLKSSTKEQLTVCNESENPKAMESNNVFYWNEGVDISQLCRICGNPDDNLIPIFQGEGLEQDLKVKIDKHLPVKVSWDDLLPANICYVCASTLTAWDNLYSECVLAEQKLRQLVLCLKEEGLEVRSKIARKVLQIPEPLEEQEQDQEEEEVEVVEEEEPQQQHEEEEEEEEEQQPPSDSELQEDYMYDDSCESTKEGTLEDPSVVYDYSGVQNEEEPDACEDDNQSESEFPTEYLYSSGGESIKGETIEEETPLEDSQFPQEDEPSSYPEEDIQDEVEYPKEVTNATTEDHAYTITLDQRKLIKKKSSEPKVFLVKCSKTSKLSVEEQVAKALNFLQSRDTGSGQERSIIKMFQPNKIHNKQQPHKSVLLNNDNSEIKSEFPECEVRILDQPTQEEPVQGGESSMKVNFGEMDIELSEGRENHAQSRFHSTNKNILIKYGSEISEGIKNETGLLPSPKSSESNQTVLWPSQFFLQSEGNGNVVVYANPEVEQTNSFMNVNNSCGSVLKIQKSDGTQSVGVKSQQLIFVPVKTQLQYQPSKETRPKQNTKSLRFKCEACGKKFSSRASLSSHWMVARSDLRCCKCRVQMENEDDLTVHMKSHLKLIPKSGPGAKKARKVAYEPLMCQVCGKLLQNIMCLNRHMMLHTGNRPFACDLCQKTFCTKLSRDDHRHTHTGEKPYLCDMCERSFSYRSHLSLHRNSHLHERPYECALCKKRFNRRQYLILHIRTHTGEKPYACDICSRAFAQRNDMNKHRLTHSWERTFVCKCGVSFKQKRDLQKHKKSHKFDIESSENIASGNEGNHIFYFEDVQDQSTVELT